MVVNGVHKPILKESTVIKETCEEQKIKVMCTNNYISLEFAVPCIREDTKTLREDTKALIEIVKGCIDKMIDKYTR